MHETLANRSLSADLHSNRVTSPGIERDAPDAGIAAPQSCIVSSINGAGVADGGLYKDAVCARQ